VQALLSHLHNNLHLLKRFKNHWRLPVYLSIPLTVCSVVNTTLFHTLIELFTICIAFMCFVVSWHTYSFLRNKVLVFLGLGYLWVGIFDLLHTLTFKDMQIFPHISPSTSLQFWLLARFFESLVMLIASLTWVNKFKPKLAFALFSFTNIGIILFLLASRYANEWLPELFIPDVGLTKVKVFSEYAIICIFFAAAIRLKFFSKHIEKETSSLLVISIALTILAEIHFTLYSGMEALSIIFGHVFKLFSFWAIYRALIESSLTRPFKSLSLVADSYDNVPDPTVIINEFGIIQQANKAVRKNYIDDVIGEDCHNILHQKSMLKSECPICIAIKEKKAIKAYEFFDMDKQVWFEAALSGIHYSESYSVIVHSLRDISLRKYGQDKFTSLNRVYRVLSHTNQAIVKIKSQDELLQKVCDIAVKQGDLKMAWIGELDGFAVVPKFIAGEDLGYFSSMQMRIDDTEWSKGPVGIAANTKKVAYVNDVHTHPDFWPWRKAATERGFEALAAVPLIIENELTGIFTLYSAQKNVFDNELIQLLENLSNDISSALFNIKQSKLKLLADTTILKLSSAVEQSADAIIITNTEGEIEYINPEFTSLTGYTESDAVGQKTSILNSHKNDVSVYKHLWATIQTGKLWRGELLNKKKDGDTYWSKQSIAPIKDKNGTITHFVSTSTDNTELHIAQDTIKELAFYDPLTKLANRRLLLDRLEHAVLSAKRHKENVAVFMLDLDNFKTINDSLGHEYGDQLLQHIAVIIQEGIAGEDTVARLGGDEFTIVVSCYDNELELAGIAEHILLRLEKPIQLNETQVVVSSSIGVSLFPQDGRTPHELLRSADLAMYHAKETGKNKFNFYQQEMNERAQGRLKIENQLRLAIEDKAFELHYQPQVDMRNNEIIGFEALIRWPQKDGSYIPPVEFIPIAEESGLIGIIGDWVINQAISDWSVLVRHGFTHSRMAVNVSAYQFKHAKNLSHVISSALKRNRNCPPSHLTIELTESTLIEDIEDTILTLETLKGIGVDLSIDDFGTGYSSLNYLKRFPVDQLKIDKSFVDDLIQGTSDEAIVSTIISIGQKLKMKIIAEGVESQEQAILLKEYACHFAQGYFYHKPLPLDEVKSLI